MILKKLLIVPALAFATSLPLAAQVIDFTTSNGFSIGSLNGQQDWLAESSWSVDPSGSGKATTTTANEIAVLNDPITLTSGQSYSYSVNFQFQGTLTQPTAGQFTYAILTGLTGINTATERGLNTEAADVNIQIIGNNNNYRLLDAFAVPAGSSAINGATPLNEGDVLQLDYTLTLGSDAASTIYTVRLQNLTDSTDTGTGTVTGIDPSLYTALTGSGAYYFFEADGFTAAASGITGVQLNSVALPETVVDGPEIEFIAAEGFSDGALGGQQGWLAESSWTVGDSAGVGHIATATTNEIAVYNQPVQLTNGQTWSFSQKYQYQGTLVTPTAAIYTLLSGLKADNSATSHVLTGDVAADVNVQFLLNGNTRMLNNFTPLGTEIVRPSAGDVLQLDYEITLGPDAASSFYTARLQNLAGSTDTGTATVTGIDASIYNALTGSGAYYFFNTAGFSAGSSGVTGVQVDSTLIELGTTPPEPPVIPAATASVDIVNASLEVNSGLNGNSLNGQEALGWGGNASLHKGNNDYGNGGWAISMESSEVAMQLTSRLIETGAAYATRFDAALFNNGSASGNQTFAADFFVVDGETANVIASRTFTVSTSTSGNWGHYQLIATAGSLDAHAGKLLGVQFRGIALASDVSILVDNVRLDAYPAGSPDGSFSVDWNTTPDQAWAGPGFWGNRLQDWVVSSGRVQCTKGTLDRRTLHRAGTSIRGNGENFTFTVRTGLNTGSNASSTRTGFLLGAGPNLDWRAQLLVHDGIGRDFGTFFGFTGTGQAIIENLNGSPATTLNSGANPGSLPADARLELSGTYNAGSGTYDLVLNAYNHSTSALISSATTSLSSDRLRGGIALMSHRGNTSATYWYDDFTGTGNAFQPEPDRSLVFLGSMYTLSKGTLKITAQLNAVAVNGVSPLVTMETFDGSTWNLVDTVAVDNTDNLSSYTATFKIPNWDGTVDTDYRLGITLDGTTYYRSGTIRRDPVDKNPLVIANTTCQRIADGNIQADNSDWTPLNIWHPHDQLWTHIAKQKPDVILAVGDQIYEWTSPTEEDNSSDYNRQHDYLYKWFFWVLQVRDVTTDIPTVAIPDDHDIFQGNFWGEGGAVNPGGDEGTGGYQSPGSWIRMVERTQTSNLPDADPYNTTQPAPSTGALNLEVYFTGMVYGGAGFAILEDRKFKTGPTNPPPSNDQYLLGDRQHDFLRNWATDWDGQKIKLAVSQTPFASVTTHSGTNYGYFGVNSTDGGGWPVHRRNEAWEHLRLSRMFQLAGDLHVATVSKSGVDGPADAGYTFCAPAVGNFFPRIWDPQHNASGLNPQNPETYNSYLGDYYNQNGLTFPHHRRMLAAANSYEYYGKTRGLSPANYHDRGIGYGIILLDKKSRRITFECWPTHADPEFPSTGSQYKDWPITFNQTDNDGRTPAGFLPLVNSGAQTDPVVSIYKESTGELVYSQRILGNSFRPPVYDMGSTYRTEISHGDGPVSITLPGQTASAEGAAAISKFVALQPSIQNGTSALLQWDVASVTTLTIDHGVGDVKEYTVNGIGHLAVSPSSHTTYTLTLNGGMTAQTTVLVFPSKADWLDAHFSEAEQNNPFVSGDDVDADGDGFTNGDEFRFQTDPRSGSDHPWTGSVIHLDNGNVIVEFDMPFPIGSVTYVPIVEVSTNLSDWSVLPANSYQETSRESTAPGTSRVTIQLTDTTAGKTNYFYRAAW